MTFKFGERTPSKIVKFRRVRYTRYYGDGTSYTTLLSTRYAMSDNEKRRAHRKADAINERWDPNSPSYKRPKWPNRHNTIIREEAKVIIHEEDVGNSIPVYM